MKTEDPGTESPIQYSAKKKKNQAHPDSAMISGATYVGVPHTVYKGPSTTVARPKSPSFNDFVPSGYSNTYDEKHAQLKPTEHLNL